MNQIIRPYFGGLGDSLQFSTLPRRFSLIGDNPFLAYDVPYRNPEIKELVWNMNPYMRGESSNPPTAGDSVVAYKNLKHGFIGNWEAAHGLEPPYSKYPKVYYNAKNIPELNDKVLVDLSCTSLYEEYMSIPDFSSLVKGFVGDNEAVVAVFKKQITHGTRLTIFYPADTIEISDIFHYCDALVSCKKLVCLFSGPQVLASALHAQKKIDVDCLMVRHAKLYSADIQRLYFFDNIKYHWI